MSDWDRLLQLLTADVPDTAGPTDAEWERLARLAQQLAVAPLLYARLTQSGVAPPPAAALASLRTAYLHAAMHNTRTYHFLAEALDALAAAGVPVLLLKGAYLAQHVYGNVALRPMGDIDLVVPEEQLSAAAQALQGIGYAMARPLRRVGHGREHHLPPFLRPGAPCVEVHGASSFLLLPRPLPAAELTRMWADARTVTITGRSALALAPEDQVLTLCAHAAFGHRFVVDLRPFFDIAAVIRQAGATLDWGTIVAHAQQWGIATACGLSLHLACAWAAAPLPPAAEALIPPEVADAALINYLREKVLTAPAQRLTIDCYAPVAAGETEEAWLTLRLDAWYGTRGLTIKTRPLLEGLFPPPAAMARRYPRMGAGLGSLLWHYLCRLIALGGRWLALPWLLLAGRLTIRAPFADEVRLRRLLRRG
jgi:hypothetical protein